jgi:hypothetical protein
MQSNLIFTVPLLLILTTLFTAAYFTALYDDRK